MVKTKLRIKKVIRPLIGPVLKILYIKVFGRQLFVNHYARKLYLVNKLINTLEVRMIIAQSTHDREVEYLIWVKQNYPREQELALQRRQQYDFKDRPLISLLVPTFNTHPRFLSECIESVLAQTYDNWELCLADDASTKTQVCKILKAYASKDDRIRYTVRRKNGHICRASNSALKLAKGEFIALLDHDDILWPNSLHEVIKALNYNPKIDFIYSDEDKIDENSQLHSEPFFKPNWSPEYLRSVNYITHFAVLRRSIVEKIGGFRPGYEGAQDWDLFLRVSRETNNIHHISKVLYSWRKSKSSTARQPHVKEYAYVNQRRALQDDLKQRGLKADVGWQIPYSMWRLDYKLKSDPLVSIIIPTKNQFEYIQRCLQSIWEKSKYLNYEVLIVDTGSTDKRVWELYKIYDELPINLKVLKWEKRFNFSAVCNFGARHSEGDYLIFLNNDTEVITQSWIEDMLGYAQQKDIGAVGCKLLYPDGRIQHGGIILGVGGQHGTPGIAGHFFPAFKDNPPQDPAQSLYIGGTRNFAAVTAACVMVARDKFNNVQGFDSKFRIAFNDVDFCLKLLDLGCRNVYLPHVQLFHHESVSVGQPGSRNRDLAEFDKEIKMMLGRWSSMIENDPYYHPEFRKDIASARLKVYQVK